MKKPLIESIIFHIVIAVLLIASTWSFFSRREEPLDEMPITVSLAPMGEKTNLKPAPKRQVKSEPQKPVPKPPEKKLEPKPPEQKKVEPKPQPKAEPKKTELVKSEPKKPETKPEKPKVDELDKLLKDMDKKPVEPQKSSNEEVTKEDSKSDIPFDKNSPEALAQEDYIKKLITDQVKLCWSPPAGVNGAKNLVVRVDVDIARDGTMKFVGFENDAPYKSDPTYQAAADSARRAVLDPECSPLRELPPADKYNIWKEMTLIFDPKDLIY